LRVSPSKNRLLIMHLRVQKVNQLWQVYQEHKLVVCRE
jgi:hypothetical protein